VRKGNNGDKKKRGKPTSESGILPASAVVGTCDVGTVPSVSFASRVASRADFSREVSLPVTDGAYKPPSLEAAVVGLLACGPDVKCDIGSAVSSPCFRAVSDHLPLSSMSAAGHICSCWGVLSETNFTSLLAVTSAPNRVLSERILRDIVVSTHCQRHSLSTRTSHLVTYAVCVFASKTSKKATEQMFMKHDSGKFHQKRVAITVSDQIW
jgi:hypothetical protein